MKNLCFKEKKIYHESNACLLSGFLYTLGVVEIKRSLSAWIHNPREFGLNKGCEFTVTSQIFPNFLENKFCMCQLQILQHGLGAVAVSSYLPLYHSNSSSHKTH